MTNRLLLMAPTKKLSVENALREVQRLIRKHDPRGEELPIGTRNVDVPGAEPPKVSYSFFIDESEAVARAATVLREDLRFEHLDDPEKSAWEFADEVLGHKKGDRVPEFVTEHAREVLDRRCSLPIEYLKLTAPIELGRVRLLPVPESELPEAQPPWFLLDPPVGAVAVVGVSGTNGHRMADRARAEVRFELRKLQLGMRGMNLYHERQLLSTERPLYVRPGWAGVEPSRRLALRGRAAAGKSREDEERLAGIGPSEISRRAGHFSVAFTYDCGHLFPQIDKQAAQMLERVQVVTAT